MKTLSVGSVGLLGLCLAPAVHAQLPTLPDNPNGSNGVPGRARNDPSAGIRTSVEGGGATVHREPRVIANGPLAPASEDRDAWREFLHDKHSGLIRLMPREKYDRSISHAPQRIKMRGGGAYYSFALLTHEYGYGSDIELDKNTLSVGFAGTDYGVLQNLGDVPLADITLKDQRTFILAHYQVPRSERYARSAYMQLGEGVVINGETFARRLPMVVDNPYLLRSIIFPGTDVLVAFRVIRRDADGSATILWKLLKQSSNRPNN